MPSSIVLHWRKLTGPVHPEDSTVFARNSHSFNLAFPPPAYIGDIENAPVVLLDANGGYDSDVTPKEFADNAACERFLDLLHNPRAVDPNLIAPYYSKRNYAELVRTGDLALVNAVAYRSEAISREPDNRQVAEFLTSTRVHRSWLRKELLKDAEAGHRLVVAHRNSLWKLKRTERPAGVVFSNNPVSANLSRSALLRIREWLG